MVSRYLRLKELLGNEVFPRFLLKELVDEEYLFSDTNTRCCKIIKETMKHLLTMVNL